MSESLENPFTSLYSEISSTRDVKKHYFATVSSVSASGIGLSIDGDTSSTKKYAYNLDAKFSVGDRVLLAKESGTYVVICRIGTPARAAVVLAQEIPEETSTESLPELNMDMVDMGYNEINANNYLVALNNIVGILKKQGIIK